MIEVKAVADIDKETTEVSMHLNGTGEELVHEALGVIEGMMRDIKKQSGYLHHLILKELADNPKILIGGESDKAVEFAKMMADMTSKSVIGKGELN